MSIDGLVENLAHIQVVMVSRSPFLGLIVSNIEYKEAIRTMISSRSG